MSASDCSFGPEALPVDPQGCPVDPNGLTSNEADLEVAGLKILCPGGSCQNPKDDITSQTQTIGVGAQIALISAFDPPLPNGVTVTGQNWQIDGTYVGGFVSSTTPGSPGSKCPANPPAPNVNSGFSCVPDRTGPP